MWNKIKVFLKAQVSAFTGGLVDYLIMVFMTEVFLIHYTIGIAIGGVIGAVVNFSLNKSWTFKKEGKNYKNSNLVQFIKFTLVVINSIVLKATGTYWITTYLKLDYKISRIITDLVVSLGFNYILQRYWVFNTNKKVDGSTYLSDL